MANIYGSMWCPTCGIPYGGAGFGYPFGPMGTAPFGYGPGYGPGYGAGLGYGPGFGFGGPMTMGGTYPGFGFYGPTWAPGYFGPGYFGAGATPSDDEIKQMVYDSLDADPAIPFDSDIRVDVTGGIVTLTGTVPNKRIKHAAGDDAWWIPGVWDVNNNLEIVPRRERAEARPEGAPAPEAPPPRAERRAARRPTPGPTYGRPYGAY